MEHDSGLNLKVDQLRAEGHKHTALQRVPIPQILGYSGDDAGHHREIWDCHCVRQETRANNHWAFPKSAFHISFLLTKWSASPLIASIGLCAKYFQITTHDQAILLGWRILL